MVIHHGYCTQCHSHCGVTVKVEGNRLLEVKSDPDHPNAGICALGAAAPELLHRADRLLYPMRRTRPKGEFDAGWERVSWDEALEEIAQQIKRAQRLYGSESIAFSRPTGSASPSSDWSPFLHRLANRIGTPNIVSTSYICQWSRDFGSRYTYGMGLPEPDFENASLICIWGHNPAHTGLQTWKRIRQAQRRGAKLIVVDPRRTATADAADLWISPRPGKDGFLIMGLIRLLMAGQGYDSAFLSRYTNANWLIDRHTGEVLRDERGEPLVSPSGSPNLLLKPFERRSASVGKRVVTVWQLLWEAVEEMTPQNVERHTGVPADLIQRFASMLAGIRPVCYYSWNGIEQHDNSFMTNRAICVLYTLTGSLGRVGGNRPAAKLPKGDLERPDWLPRTTRPRIGLDRNPVGAPNRSVTGYDLVRAVLDGDPYPVRVLLSFGGNLVTQHPGSVRMAEALQRLDFHVHVDLFDSPMSRSADLLLPAAAGWESEALRIGFDGLEDRAAHVQYREAAVPPPGQAKPDGQILLEIGVRLGYAEDFWHGDRRSAYREMLAPLESMGVTLEELKKHPRGITVPLETLPEVTRWPTSSGKIELYSEKLLQSGYPPLPEFPDSLPGVEEPDRGEEATGELLVSSYKLRYFCHSQHRGVPSLRRRVPHPIFEMHPRTAQQHELKEGDWIQLFSEHGALQGKVHLQPRVPEGTVFAQAGWWESCPDLNLPGYDPFSDSGANLNRLIGTDRLDPISGAVALKAYPCSIQKIATHSEAVEH